jgi:hypothetical protein
VRALAVTYLVLFVACCAGAVLLAVQGKLFVTLAQRSNVETLTILFLLVFYAYLGWLSAPGALGALRIVAWAARRKASRDPDQARRHQLAALGRRSDGPYAALSAVVERSDGQPARFELRGAAGSLGFIEVTGARLRQREALGGGSPDVLAYFVHQLAKVLEGEVSIVLWGQLDDEDAERYLGQVEFARNLRQHLGAAPLWPTLLLSPQQCEELERRLGEISHFMLDDALLPDWEYSAEHKLPVIPEPLGLVSLGRSARRADPVATMGFAAVMVLITLAVIVLFILHKPWVPG